MTIKVIGAGMGRTGTLSLKVALEQLGYGKCYHMIELILNEPQRVVYWEQAFAGKPVNWDAAFVGYQATVDFPGYRVYKQLLDYYPDARVILTVRDPESWYESANATIYRAEPGLLGKLKMGVKVPFSARVRNQIRVFQLTRAVWQEDFAGRFEDRAFAIERYQQHIADVQATVPADQLLVFDVREGWEPLCNFLGVPVPDAPFPQTNSRAEFQSRSL